MIGEKEIDFVFDKLVEDESFCRLLYYGVDPFSEDKKDITSMEDYKKIMNEVIKFAPQVSDIEKEEKTRLNMYKQFTKLRNQSSVVRFETLQFDIYVPHRLMNEDKRVYQIESKISNILDGIQMGIGYMEYVDGSFTQVTNVSGYVQYKMMFVIEEGRNIRYGR